jgi:glycosyltransferase involved in cell wall biosynthesis
MHEVYTQYNLFILPSKFEAFGAVVMEAMAHSLPVIASHTVGAADYIEEGIHGFTFTLGDTQDFTDKVKIFLDQPKLLQHM